MATLHEQLLSKEINPQHDSPLFAIFPAEIRTKIFSFALADYQDASLEYLAATCYTRPSYFAPRKSSVQLLRTCRAIYRETWFLPWTLKEQTHWITSKNRAPPEYEAWNSFSQLRQRLPQIARQQGQDKIEIDSLHAFAQMYKLEEGGLAGLLRIPGLHPRTLTLTIRHTDWWFWENDQPLRFEGGWIKDVCEAMSPSTREFRIELESLERKKAQVDAIARQMTRSWFFKRPDGAVLYADVLGACNDVSRWSGTSTWRGKRWTRDETEPGKIAYYIVAVAFRLEHALKRRGGEVSDEARQAAMADDFDHHRMRLSVQEQTQQPVDDLDWEQETDPETDPDMDYEDDSEFDDEDEAS